MRKQLLVLFFIILVFSIQVFANNDNDFTQGLPEEIKSLIENANKVSRDNVEKSVAMLQRLVDDLQQKNTYSTKQRYDILQKLEKSIGVIYEDNNQLDKAKEHYVRELTFVELSGNLEAKMGVFIDLAIVEKRKGNYKEAKENYLKCLEIAEKENNNKLQDFAYYGLGTLYEAGGEYEKAVESYLKSLKLADERGSRSDAINTLQNLAITYSKLNNNKLALETIEKAYSETGNVKDSTLLASIIFDYGKVLNNAGNYDAAIIKFQHSFEIFKKLNFKPLIARSMFYMADTYTKKGDYNKAQSLFLECEKYKNYISKRSSAELHIKLGDMYLLKTDLEKSKGFYITAFEISDKCDYRELKKESSQKLAVVYDKLGDFKEAYFYLNKASEIKDSLYNEKQSKGIAELQMKYDSEKSAHEIAALKFRQGQMWFLFGGLMGLALILAAFYLVRLRGKTNAELKFKNEQIKEQNKRLTDQNEALEQFAYAAAHDLKEPLRNIGSFANLLQRRYGNQFDENAKEYMDFILNGAKRMNELLIGLLNLSSLAAQQANNEYVNLSDVIDVVKNNLKTSLEEKNAKISFKGGTKLIPMNQLHMIQLIQNLVGNAIKFVEKVPTVEIFSRETDSYFEIEVKDNGIGMEKAYEAKVFRLFQRLEKTKNYEGNGVGLSICKNIVEKYGGKIWFESELNHGTQFFIQIPKNIALKAA